MVALVRRCREQHQVASMLLQHLGQLEVLRLYEFAVLAIGREMVCFIEYNQVPRRCRLQPCHAWAQFQRVDAGNQEIVFLESVGLAVGDVAFAAEDLKVQMKHIVQLAVPIVDQTSRNHHQRTLQFATADQFPQDECRLNRLPKAHFISDEEAAWIGRGHSMCEHDLMGKKVNSWPRSEN